MMRKLLVTLGIVLLLMGCCRYATVVKPASNYLALANTLTTYSVQVKHQQDWPFTCSGTVIEQDNRVVVLTARHCFDVCPEASPTTCVGLIDDKVAVNDDEVWHDAKLVKSSTKYDLLLYEITGSYVLPVARIAESEPGLTNRVWTCGCPGGTCDTIQTGRVAKLRMKIEKMWPNQPLSLMDVGTVGGTSGGGVFNNDGEMVGVVVGTRGSAIGIYIPLEGVREFLNE